jgi:thiopurine S-methyltransferase
VLEWLRSLITSKAKDEPTWDLMDLTLPSDAAFCDPGAWDRAYAKLSLDSYWTDYLHAYTLEYLDVLGEVAPSPPAKVLVPACGASVAPHVLSAQGYEVVATDISAEAIACQARIAQAWTEPAGPSQWDVRKRWRRWTEDPGAGTAGSLQLQVADQREALEGGPFALVFSERALQNMSRQDRRSVLAHQYAALTPEGAALFAFVNTSDELRAEFEEDLATVGFSLSSGQGQPPGARPGRRALTYYRWL